MMQKHANIYKDENGHTLLSLNYAQLFIHIAMQTMQTFALM